MFEFKCKACENTECKELIDGRKECTKCGKIAKKKLSEALYTKFHPEITITPLKRNDIIGVPIILLDASEPTVSKASKFKSKSCLILIKFDVEDMTPGELDNLRFVCQNKGLTLEKEAVNHLTQKFLIWVNGSVLLDQLQKLKDSGDIPSKEGLTTTIVTIETDDGLYYKFE